MGSSVYAFECLLFNTKNSGNATVIPTFPYSFASFGTTEYNITKFSCGFPTTRVPSKPSFPSYTAVLWSHYNPRGTVKPSYTSVGCLFSSQTSQTKTLTKTATASCISSCSMSLGIGLFAPILIMTRPMHSAPYSINPVMQVFQILQRGPLADS